MGRMNLMRIGDEAWNALGRPGGAQHAACPICRGSQTLETLVQHPLYRALGDA